eukprot:466071-Prymnesium_polylepis.2
MAQKVPAKQSGKSQDRFRNGVSQVLIPNSARVQRQALGPQPTRMRATACAGPLVRVQRQTLPRPTLSLHQPKRRHTATRKHAHGREAACEDCAIAVSSPRPPGVPSESTRSQAGGEADAVGLSYCRTTTDRITARFSVYSFGRVACPA